MKIKTLLFLSLNLFVGYSFAAQQDSTKTSPLTFNASYIGEGASNFSGGLKTGGSYLGTANIRILFSTSDAKLWNGGQFFVNGANTHGGEPSANLVGDMQGVSNIEAGNLTYLHELWYRQDVGRVSAIVGLQDLNAEFISSPSNALFFNGSFGTPSSISENIHAPIFPITALGAHLQYRCSKNIVVKIAVFDGFLDDVLNNPYNIKWHLNKNDGVSTFSELTINKSIIKDGMGLYKVGLFTHNHLGVNDADLDSSAIGTKTGFYLIGDQKLFETTSGRKFSIFAQLCYCPSPNVRNSSNLGLGFNFQGLILNRPNDVFGIAMARAKFNNYLVNHETSLEFTYKAIISDNVFVQPNFQYVINPSGTDVMLGNAAVGIIRFGFTF